MDKKEEKEEKEENTELKENKKEEEEQNEKQSQPGFFQKYLWFILFFIAFQIGLKFFKLYI